jgi:hypothetical protein
MSIYSEKVKIQIKNGTKNGLKMLTKNRLKIVVKRTKNGTKNGLKNYRILERNKKIKRAKKENFRLNVQEFSLLRTPANAL